MLLPRLVRAWNAIPKAKESLAESPAVYARRFFYDALVFALGARLTEGLGGEARDHHRQPQVVQPEVGGGPPLAVEGLPREPREDMVGDPEDDHHHESGQDDVRMRESPTRPGMGCIEGVARSRQGEEHPQESPQEEVRHSSLQEPDRGRVHRPLASPFAAARRIP